MRGPGSRSVSIPPAMKLAARSGWARRRVRPMAPPFEGVVTTPSHARAPATPLAGLDEQALDAGPDAAPLVVERRRRRARAEIGQSSDSVQADPLTDGRAFDMHGDVGVDEHPPVERQCRAHTVAEVGRGDEPLHRGRRLTGDDRLAQADPRESPARLPPTTPRVTDVGAIG